MYFQIENTPEHVRRARKAERVPKEPPKEECPRLILAPFSKPPQVIFDNVLIGTSCERNLELFNPSKQSQQITLSKALPPGLVIQLPSEWLELEPETCYCVSLLWTPMQPTAMRDTIRFTNENRGRYDVIVVLKSIMNNNKGKNQPKGFKTSPRKMKKKVLKKSPVSIYKKKSEIIFKTTTEIKKTVNVAQSTLHKVYQTPHKENLNDYSVDGYGKCPFDSPTSNDLNFDTSEIFSKKTKYLQETYDKSYDSTTCRAEIPQNLLKPSNILNESTTNIFDNLSFTPLKTKTEKLDKGPKIILSVNSDSDLNDSVDLKDSNKENLTHSFISITTSLPPNKWLTVNHQMQVDNQFGKPAVQTKKHPNTSSPKEFNSPNFSINTDFSRISDMSFMPQRFSTERKCLPKTNDTQEMVDFKLSSYTYTQESPITPMEHNIYQSNIERPPHFFTREQPKMCRQSLFREYQQKENFDINYLNPYEHNVWQSPARSITPPLQSIPEESAQFETQILDRTDQKNMNTFSINRTFDKPFERPSTSMSCRETWAKKAVRCEPDLWKAPVFRAKKSMKAKSFVKPKESSGSRINNTTFDSNRTINQNLTINQVGNVYSQSFTVDPFLSSTYFYDEEAVDKFEIEFKSWLNCILTPPADLDSNVEQKIDVGKAWIENRNKEVPLAPTREHVSNVYHNSHRLESLRKAARALFMSPEIAQVFKKLNAQIEKKLIAIRTDRNLHLDVGLQKAIMELILSYNPLWLRIGLEAIYGIVLPLKSNSDIEGLTTFVVQRMFKNPHLKNKHSKANAPNVLLPAYMEAIKKFTLKKFFMLVFFLDQAKQRKLIQHDPCLFCRNAICKESREIVIRFTREVIAGIGDITKHLRPLGYVVCHKQSFLDEYKYAVHNIALDIKDGVRLTKVLEIILMKNGLLNQLRTPAISRLQRIHNVQVALNALKDTDFSIDGDITAADIADGHREKTLSLLWQLIHVLRAPLFEKAANVIQVWWRKKYEVIVEERRVEAKARMRLTNAASIIQHWWRRTHYNRQVEWQMQRVTTATIVVQKYCRMWLCRTRLRKIKTSVQIIERWYRSVRMIREAKLTLENLWLERQELMRKSAVVIQSHVRRWFCVRRYKTTLEKTVHLQTAIRRYIVRSWYLRLKKAVSYVQQKFRGKLLMRAEMRKLSLQKRSAITIQSYYRMIKQRRSFLAIKKSVQVIKTHYIALRKMCEQRHKYLELRRNVIAMQALYRGKKCCMEYTRQRNVIISLQRRFRANRLMKNQKAEYDQTRNAVITLQTQYRSWLSMKKERTAFLKLKNAAVTTQRHYRAQVEMKKCKESYTKLRFATLSLQRRYRALLEMRKQRIIYLQLKLSCMVIQIAYRAYALGKRDKANYLKLKSAAVKLQNWFRNCKRGKEAQQQYKRTKQACVTIQTYYKAYIIGKKQRQEFVRIKTATICIQKFYRSHIITRTIRRQFIQLKTSIIKIQRFYKSYLETKKQREEYLRMKSAVYCIETCYRRFREYRMARIRYIELRKTTIFMQRRFRSVIAMKLQRTEYLKLKRSAVVLQQSYRALLAMRTERKTFVTLRSAVVTVQTLFRAQRLMRETRTTYIAILSACKVLQSRYKAHLARKKQREQYNHAKSAAVLIQTWFRALMETRKAQHQYLLLRNTVILIQRRFRANKTARVIRQNEAATKIQTWYRSLQKQVVCRRKYLHVRRSVIIIQSVIRMFIHSSRFLEVKSATLTIQRYYRCNKQGKNERQNYLQVRRSIIKLQSFARSFILRKRYLRIRATALVMQAVYRLKRQQALVHQQRESAVVCLQKNIRRYLVQSWYRTYRKKTIYIQQIWRGKLNTRLIRCEFLQKRRFIIKVQSVARGYLVRKMVQCKKDYILRLKEEKRQYWAVTKIQAFFRGHKARNLTKDQNVINLRRRWRGGALKSNQESLRDRNHEAMKVLMDMSGIHLVINAFRSLEFLTEVFPMLYNNNAAAVVNRVHDYMCVTNRSISSIEVLKSSAAILVNLTRYKVTGPMIYARERLSDILKFMLRFSNTEIQLFCILATHLWLFSKYEDVKIDLAEFLHLPENHKICVNIKTNVQKMKRMAGNTSKNKFAQFSHTRNVSTYSGFNNSFLPTVDPDYGIVRVDKPRYFKDAHQAINCLFNTYKL